MNGISWQDPFKKETSRNKGRVESRQGHGRSSNSFATQFLRDGQSMDQESQGNQSRETRFSDRYLDSSQGYGYDSVAPEKSGSYEYAPPLYDNSFNRPTPPMGGFHQPPPQPNAYSNPQNGYQQISPGIPVHAEPQNGYAQYQQNFAGEQAQAYPQWRFLDLSNKKQTGDLHKKMLTHTNKNNSKTFCFTSSTGKEGVSTIVANLTEYIRTHASDKVTIVIDSNLKTPSLDKIFNVSKNSVGLVDFLNNRVALRDALTPVAPNVFLLPSGNISNYQFSNIGSESFVRLLQECRQLADYTLIDCPPVLSSSDSLTVAPVADVSFLTVKAKVHRQVVQKALSLLQNNECELGGIVFNRVQQVIPGWVYKFI